MQDGMMPNGNKIKEEKWFSMREIFGENKKYNNTLKLLALIFMCIDYLGMVLFSENEIFRMIGCLALPVFAYYLANGYVNTLNRSQYFKRIWIFAIISQIPYTLLFETYTLNILFTYFLALCILYFLDKKKYSYIPLLLIILILLPFNYEWYGVGMVLVFNLFKNKPYWILVGQAVLTGLYVATGAPVYQFLSLLGVLLALYFPRNKWSLYIGKYFFYWFYPTQLVFLFLLKWFII